MNYRIQPYYTYSDALLERIAALWNGNAVGRHAFYPWSGQTLSKMLSRDDGPVGVILAAEESAGGDIVGFAHCNQLREDGYPDAGVIEMLLVDSCHRRRGVGTALLQGALDMLENFRPRPTFVDAMGAWPFGYGFNVLADGSERSGVFLSEAPLYRLFRRAHFEPVRKSVVMRAELSRAAGRPFPPGTGFFIGKRSESTWLDRVFRGRELWDHDFGRQDRRVLSRAIFGFMDGESKREGRAIFSVFGVNTPRDMQGKGYAGMNISHLMQYVRELGGEVMELHVYADNEPALRLYRGLGFEPVAETVMMHKRF